MATTGTVTLDAAPPTAPVDHMPLHGREPELARLAGLLDAARRGRSAALVVRGEAGLGKTALFDRLATDAAPDMRVVRSAGIEAEADLGYAGLHLLLRPMRSRIDDLPEAQAEALHTALGLASGVPADRLAVGLAVLTLLAELAEERPVLCIVDDAHWLDHETAQALLFAARRLEAEGVVLLFGVRDLHAPEFPASGVEEIALTALSDAAADALLAETARDLPEYVRHQIRLQSGGNPLALRELAVAQREGQLTADPYGVAPLPTHSRIVRTFTDRITALPQTTRDGLLVAAAAGVCDVTKILTAAADLGVQAGDLAIAERRELVRLTAEHFEFRHPLILTAAYQSATHDRRMAAHRALAGTFDAEADLGRRAWHLAAAATGPDETVAAALEAGAEQSRERGGYSAVSVGYERAGRLSPDPRERARRLTEAAKAALDAGQLDRAARLTDQSSRQHRDTVTCADRAMVQATAAMWRGHPMDAYETWRDTASVVASETPDRASHMLFHAAEAAWTAGRFTRVREAADLAERLALPRAPWVRAMARVAAGFNGHADGSMADGVAALRELLDVTERRDRLPPQDASRQVWWYLMLGDHEHGRTLAERLVAECRATGAVGVLPRALGLLSKAQLYGGRLRDAVATADEALAIADPSTGRNLVSVGVPVGVKATVAAMRGDEAEVRRVLDDSVADVKYGIVVVDGARALRDMSLGRYDAVVERLVGLTSSENPMDVLPMVPDLVEAAVRTGDVTPALGPYEWFRSYAEATGADAPIAVELRCRALLAGDGEAEELFRAALERHRVAGRPFEQARTELLYGEWLRRNRRRVDARVQLRAALTGFERLGVAPWADRAVNELRAAGEGRAHPAEPGRLERLTPQELQVVRLAAKGMTNRDIGGQLFLSPRTVGYHLYKAYPKLGVTSRGELVSLDLSA
ncbi:putative ATPase [Stackebrandtia albiflava]|uniref:Putative ATPase n=1 Tax=Stackebrandtia albiflava TaxID=406432 RepID=A0A562URQ8_9ACTN|nr:LuxR family transcriptional regulator [Stackebrandtia albiflava]TWJ08303.1 putative ATPase [Stackebrandtia albiflava]